jgi:cation transport protein ChaC
MRPEPTHLFAYGSLMWNPGGIHTEPIPALASGWERSWCVRSTHHRGTPDEPGLVLGLVRGGACVGCAYPLNGVSEIVLRDIDQRELAEPGYARMQLDLLTDVGQISALAYVTPHAHKTEMRDIQIIRAITRAKGVSGSNLEYAVRTAAALRSLSGPKHWPSPCPGICTAALSAAMSA